ncbi:hypothetical protein GQ53DRAFT_843762 [Thozetella sp. PMI_491]|nr:hypothetical protein GQ53DRAFT_843762 [Thozetella sp. PMI_491]
MDPTAVTFKPPTPGRESNTPMILGAAGFMTGLAVIIASVRFYVRQFILKSFGWDDWVMVVATLHTITVLACFIGQVQNGAGHHWYDIGIPDEWEALKHWQYAQVCVAIIGVSVVKVSVGFGLLRFMKTKWYRRFIISMIAFVVVATIASVGPLLFECHPMYVSWAYIRPVGVCISSESFRAVAELNGIINVVTDFIFVVTPIPTIVQLKVNRKTKISLIAVICLGFLAVATAIVRLVIGNKPWQLSDGPWNLTFYIWNSAELNAGIIAASLPPLRPLLGHWLKDTAQRFRTHESPGSRYGLKSSSARGTRQGYQKQEDIKLGRVDEWSRDKDVNEAVVMAGYGKGPTSSEEEIFPSKPQGIVRRTEIVIQKE